MDELLTTLNSLNVSQVQRVEFLALRFELNAVRAEARKLQELKETAKRLYHGACRAQ